MKTMLPGKKILNKLYLLMLLAWLAVSQSSCTVYVYTPASNISFSGTTTYCQNDVASPNTYTYGQCNDGGTFVLIGFDAGTNCTVQWYYNTTGVTTIAGSTPLGGPVAFTSAAGPSGTLNYTPVTTTAGVFYYFAYITWGFSACNASPMFSNTQMVTVNPLPLPITGTYSMCIGATTTLTDATAGGVWTSSPGSGSASVAGGVVTGTAVGTATISYTATGCSATQIVTVTSGPAAITGPSSVCIGQTINLTDAGGGTWASSNANATVGPTGVVTGVSAGTSTITYSIGTSCTATKIITINTNPTAILGTLSACQGFSVTLSDLTAGGTWSSSNANATVGAGTGIVSGITGGTSTISYIIGVCYTLATFTTNPTPGAINGTVNICQGLTSNLTDASGGGTWASSNSSIASIGSSSGTLLGVTAGTCTITYTLPTGCLITTSVTVNTAPTTILGTFAVCEGLTTTLSDAVGGGVWTASNTNASVGSGTGIVTGVTAGTVTISYTTATCTPVTQLVTVNPSPGTIGGTLAVCNGSTTTLTNTVGGGTWVSSNTGVATIGSSSAFLSGLSVGTTSITYTLPAGCKTISTVTVNPSPVAISGANSVCIGISTTLTDATGSGTWSSSNANTSIGSSSGIATGNTAGTSTITYTLPAGCNTTTSFTVNPSPAPISGLASGCAGLVINLSDATSGGVWVSSNSSIASVGTSSGVVVGLSVGTAIITYLLPTGCISTLVVTVNASPLAIVGSTSVCQGSSTTLNDPAIGGTWASSNPLVGTIGSSSGTVTGIGGGTTTITYTLPIGGCTSTMTFTVNPLPGAISGPNNVCASGGTITLSDATGGGTWSSLNTAAATIGAASGVVSGITAGTTLISYTLGTGCAATATITVNPLPSAITGSGVVCIGLTTTLNDATSSGTWSSTFPAVASVGSSSGVVTGVAAGATFISYTLPTGCYAVSTMSVNTPPTAIAGPNSVCIGSAMTLTDGTSGGLWSSSSVTGSVSVSGAGVVTGVTTGITVVSYTILSCNAALYSVTVNPLPAAITGVGSVCFGSSISLSDITPGGNWSSSSATVSVSSTGTVTGLSTGLGATITYTLPTGCYVTAAVNVDAIPTPIQGTDSVCKGSSVVLSDATAGGVWTSSNGTIAHSVALTGEVDGLVSGTVLMSYTLPSGCNTTIVFKVIEPLPASVSITQSPDTLLCAGETVILTTTPVNGGTPTYQWQLFGTDIPGQTAPTYSYTPDHGDYITCKMTSHGICSAPGVATGSITMNIFPMPVPQITISTASSSTAGDTASYLGDAFTFYTEVTYGGLAPKYQWYINNAPVPGATSSTFTTQVYDTNDTIYCAITAVSPCDSTTGRSNKMIIYGLGYLATNSLVSTINNFTLFPNPNTGSFVLSGKLNSTSNKPVSMEVSDVLGRSVYKGITTAKNGDVRAEIILDNNIAAGSYLLRVNTETGNETFHFVIGK